MEISRYMYVDALHKWHVCVYVCVLVHVHVFT